MGTISLRTARSLEEYVAVVESISSSSDLWFRGQKCASYRLTPGVLRNSTPITDGRKQPITEGQIVNSRGGLVDGPSPERMLQEFKRRALPFLERIPSNDFEWMFVGQHHGLPTRLLDWSTNSLVALWFAASDAALASGDGSEACDAFMNGDEFRSDGFAIFVIDPGAVNDQALSIKSPIDLSVYPQIAEKYIDPTNNMMAAYPPICILAPHASSRIRAQSGVFTLHGSNIDPLDYYDALRPLITKIFIPNTATASIQRSLKKMGVTKAFIYPSIDTVAQEISEEEYARYYSRVSKK